jgi:Xaa-Pro aminopeptidase
LPRPPGQKHTTDWKDQSGVLRLAFDPWLHTMAQIEAFGKGRMASDIVSRRKTWSMQLFDRPPPFAPFFFNYSDR